MVTAELITKELYKMIKHMIIIVPCLNLKLNLPEVEGETQGGRVCESLSTSLCQTMSRNILLSVNIGLNG